MEGQRRVEAIKMPGPDLLHTAGPGASIFFPVPDEFLLKCLSYI